MSVLEIICLANSRKISGRCIVGKTPSSNKWIRPVSNRESEEISEEERRYENGDMPQLFDIIKIPVKEHRPTLFQDENYLIHDGYYWEKNDAYKGSLDDLLDTPNDLWGTQDSSYQGLHDRFPESACGDYSNSVYLIKPQSIEIIVRTEGQEFNDAKRKIRANFTYNNTQYLFPVTDAKIERKFLSGENGRFTLSPNNIYLCVSVGLPYNGYCYKFLASIIETL